jgi:hypothetical protein
MTKGELDKYYKDLDAFETKIKAGFTGRLIKIEEVTSKDYFGESSQYRDRDGLKLTVKLNEMNDEFTEFFSKPDIRGLHKSKLFEFKKKYSKYPKLDMEVNVVFGADGFYQIDI